MAVSASDTSVTHGEYESLKVDYANYEEISKNILPRFGMYSKKVELEGMNLKEGTGESQFIASLIKYCRNLTHFEMNECDVDIRLFDDLHRWPNLEFLNFTIYSNVGKARGTKRKITKNSQFIANNVKTLKLCYMVNEPSELVQSVQFRARLLNYCPNLTHFEIKSWEEDSSIFDDLHHLPNLKFLSFDGVKIKKRRGANRETAFVLPFEKLKYLETLILSEMSLNRTCLYGMLKCENLVSINIEFLEDIPADFIESLVKAKQETLRELHINGDDDTLSDDIMEQMSNCRQLQVLHIRTCDTLSDSSLMHLSKLKSLQRLEMMSGNFSESALLDFISNNDFQQMTNLWVPDCLKFTPEVIETIKTKVPKLKVLTIGDKERRFE